MRSSVDAIVELADRLMPEELQELREMLAASAVAARNSRRRDDLITEFCRIYFPGVLARPAAFDFVAELARYVGSASWRRDRAAGAPDARSGERRQRLFEVAILTNGGSIRPRIIQELLGGAKQNRENRCAADALAAAHGVCEAERDRRFS